MNVILFGTFTVFGVHTVLWLAKLLEIRWRERRRRRELGLEDEPPARTPIDSAARGHGPLRVAVPAVPPGACTASRW